MALKLGLKALLLFFVAVEINGRSLGKYGRVVGREEASSTSYDFIIAGGGIAGLTVADRLSEDPKVSVLVIEHGGFDQGESTVLIPGFYNPFPYFWKTPFPLSTPQPGLNSRVFFIPMGDVVGGGSAINAMFFLRGAKEEYENWKALGAHGWGWNDLLPYFKKSENFTRPDATFAQERNISWTDSVHGFNGPVHASYAPYDYPSSKNFWDASLQVGVSVPKDTNDGNANGLFWLLRSEDPDSGTRSYARINHYERVKNIRPNYHLLPSTAVSKVLFKKKKAVGVQFVTRADGAVGNATAKKEVIIAAGAVHSPHILHLSGIGPKAVVQNLGIPVVSELPGVGANLQDHLVLQATYDFSSNLFPNGGSLDFNETYNAEQLDVYQSTHKGAYTLIHGTGNNIVLLPLKNTTSSYQSIISLAASQNITALLPAGTHPTVVAGYKAQRKILLQNYASYGTSIGSISWNTGPQTSIYMIKPFSRGTVTTVTTDVLTDPVLDFGALTDPTDLEVMLALVRKNRQIMAQAPMQALGPTELLPGDAVVSDEDLKAVLRDNLDPTNAHMCCTTAMLPKSLGGVLDTDLRVYGVSGLSVVGISTWPMSPAGGPQATVYASAEKAADIIKKRHGIKTFPPPS